MKLFLIHAVYNRSEICYRDLINKLKIELLKEKLLNNPKSHIMGPLRLLIIPPNAEKSICFDNEAASTSLTQQVARSSRRSVAPVQWESFCTLPKIKTPRGAHIIQRKQFNSGNCIILYECFNRLNFKRFLRVVFTPSVTSESTGR